MVVIRLFRMISFVFRLNHRLRKNRPRQHVVHAMKRTKTLTILNQQSYSISFEYFSRSLCIKIICYEIKMAKNPWHMFYAL